MPANEHTAAAIDAYREALDKILHYRARGCIDMPTARHLADRLTEAVAALGLPREETETESEVGGKPTGLPEL